MSTVCPPSLSRVSPVCFTDIQVQTFARAINHVAVSVNDIEAVTAWYTEIMGFRIIGDRIFHIK